MRHAAPRQDPSLPPWEWTLAETAAEDTRALRGAGVLPGGACWVSSPEPKAVATARLLTEGDVGIDDDLREAGRDGAYVTPSMFAERVRRSFDHVEEAVAPGWESLSRAQERLVGAARRAAKRAAGRDVVLLGHGTALTMLVAALLGSDPDVAAWTGMRFPDHCALDVPTPGGARIVSPWGAWAT